MTITRYRGVGEMPPVARPTDSAELARRIRIVWARSRRLASVSTIRGVQKFASVDAAYEARQRMLTERARRLTHRDRPAD